MMLNTTERPTSKRPRSQAVPFALGNVLLLGIAKGPDFIALEPLTGQVPQGLVLVGHAGSPNMGQELNHGVFSHAGHADGGPDGIALY